jgi:tetratricopeptide (TPR) repeat protein
MRATQFLCVSAYAAGEHAQALAAGSRVLSVATELGDVSMQAVANGYLGYSHLARTDYAQATACLRRSVDALVGSLLRDRLGQVMLPPVAFRAFLAWTLVELGEFAEAAAIADEAVQIAEDADHHPASVLIAQYGLGLTAVRQGRLARGIASLEQALAICRDLGLSFYVHYVAPPLALAYAFSGRPGEAVDLLEQAVGQDVALGVMCHHGLTLTTLAEVYLLAGRPRDARVSAEQALRLSRERQEPGHEAHALRVLGDTEAACEPPEFERAAASYQQALGLAQTLGMRPLVAHSHLGLGKLYRRTSKREQAREHLVTSTTLYRETDMQFWVGQTEAEMMVVV